MLQLIRTLWENPEAERNPEAWATTYCAHAGLGAAVTLVLLAITPAHGLALSLIGYGLWEASQAVRARSWRILADCLLDWTAWALLACAVAWGSAATAASFVLAATAILWVGVSVRSEG